MTRVEKLALLTKAFATDDGTRAVYQSAKLVVPTHLAPTVIERIEDFQRHLLEKHTVQ